MALYKNREVAVIGPNVQAASPETINIEYRDGSKENVPVSQVSFTEDEKNSLVKRFPSKYNDVSTTTPEDLEAVRVGVAPPSDPSYKAQAELEAHQKRQQEINQKNLELAKSNAEKAQKDQKPVQTQPVSTPVADTPKTYVAPNTQTTAPKAN